MPTPDPHPGPRPWPLVPHDLLTPVLLVDRDVLDRNLAAMAQHARERGLALRPHVKTHKSPQVARLQIDQGATGITVATVSEAQVFADHGFDDIFIAYPVWADPARGSRLRDLAARVSLAVGVDSTEGAHALAAQLGDLRNRVGVLVEVDTGHHRTGVLPARAGAVAVAASHCGLDVRGVFTFPGHSYAPGEAGDVAAEEARELTRAVASLEEYGVAARVVSGGSTPSASHTGGEVLTEMRPGVYVFGDAQQLELGTCGWDAIALTAAATVVSHGTDTVTLDAGSKCLGADRASWASGHGRLLDHPAARITALSEHHATVRWPQAAALPALGTRLRVVSNHVCSAVNLADQLVVVRGDRIEDVWEVSARGANT